MAVGMTYSVFSDEARIRRQNLRWLGCYRLEPSLAGLSWVVSSLEGSRVATVGELIELSEANPDVLSSLWHLVWRGTVVLDLDCVITDETAIRLGSDE